ncbi:M23 family metallopeptidase [Campylobacter geochelonis]|uniref:M24/M37 family peptidase n=1 Tax=Campylobacter geochelonis TaxID=1780362 RepID=A0A128EEY5_9BACT|nr:M23 family metallopeptidase [Campylobacter geochelonis]QKF70986.1 zinc metallopeptidase, M23 family [Campylobacter geochelonis]CZE47101.1 M24/M37 family peptidase [Campylobacter geochelonis]CZE47584.1 M24/M37 family peptidase [Campylobacter geochelonis]
MVKKTYVRLIDEDGTKSYEFSQNFRRNLKLFSFFGLFLFCALVIVIFFFYRQNANLKELSKKLYIQNTELVRQSSKLLEDKNELLKQNDVNDEMVSDLKIALALGNVSNSLKESDEDTDKIVLEDSLQKQFLRSVPNGWPILNKGVTDNYGMRVHPISKSELFHHGIDLRAKEGTPIYATADGFVEYATNSSSGYGYLVIISHNFGFKTRYGHMLNKDVVKVGQWVKRGELIGYSGNTGYSTGPHLHYEVRFLERTLDPINFINFDNIFINERKIPWQGLLKAIAEFNS